MDSVEAQGGHGGSHGSASGAGVSLGHGSAHGLASGGGSPEGSSKGISLGLACWVIAALPNERGDYGYGAADVVTQNHVLARAGEHAT